MKSATAFAVILSLLPLALACCKQDKITSCCGKGKCNIFCCNCDDGCRAETDSDNPQLSHNNTRRGYTDGDDSECACVSSVPLMNCNILTMS